MLVFWLLLISAIVALPATATPEAAGPAEGAAAASEAAPLTGRALAKHHFEKGTKLYDLGRFAEALEEFEAAYGAEPLPALLFNVGQCWRKLHRFDEAVNAYEAYLRKAPDASNREEVEELIELSRAEQMAQQQEQQERAAAEAARIAAAQQRVASDPTSSGSAPVDEPIQPWVWTAVGVGVAAALVTVAATGGVVAVIASQPAAPSLGEHDLRGALR